MRKDYTMGFGKITLYSILFILPIWIIFFVPFVLIWNYETFEKGKDWIMNYFFPFLIGGAFVHEFLHGVFWGIFAKSGLKSIRFGFKWKYLTPYCHCKDALKVKHYKIGSAMPLIILGIIPSIFAIIIGNGGVLSFGLFFTWAAGADVIVLFMLWKIDNDNYIYDHPEKMGFYEEIPGNNFFKI